MSTSQEKAKVQVTRSSSEDRKYSSRDRTWPGGCQEGGRRSHGFQGTGFPSGGDGYTEMGKDLMPMSCTLCNS